MLKIDLTDEQIMLVEASSRYMTEEYGFRERTRVIASDDGYDREKWRAFARMGWLGLPFPEAYGGAGGTALDLLLLLQSFGRALVVEPYLSTVVLGGLTVLATGNEEQKQKLLPPLIAGDLQIAAGFGEPQSGYDIDDVLARAERRGEGYSLSGHKAVVLGAPSADYFIVSARTSGGQRDREGIALFLLQRSLPGISLRSYQTIDGRRAAEVRLDDVRVSGADLLGAPGKAASALAEAALMATVALLGEAMGCLEGAVAETAAYLNVREQFGQKLASFQALRHRVADMFVGKEEVKALCLLAAGSIATRNGSGNGPDNGADNGSAVEAVSAAKAYAGQVGRKVCEEAVQLHGAIAITDEYIVGHYLKRLIAIDRLFGDTDYHLERFLASRGSFEDAAMGGPE